MLSSFKKHSLDSIDMQTSIDKGKYEDQSFKKGLKNPDDNIIP